MHSLLFPQQERLLCQIYLLHLLNRCALMKKIYLIVTYKTRTIEIVILQSNINITRIYIYIMVTLNDVRDDQSHRPLQPLIISTYNNQYKDPLFICCATTSIILVTRVRSFKTVTILYSSYQFIYRTITICIVFQILDPVTYKILSISWRYR